MQQVISSGHKTEVIVCHIIISCLRPDLTYLAQPGVPKPGITGWHVTSFQTALLGTAERLITGCGAPTAKLHTSARPEGGRRTGEERRATTPNSAAPR